MAEEKAPAEKIRFVVTNASKGARIVYHGGSGTHIAAGSSATIEMTQAEADNSWADGVSVKPEGDAKPQTQGDEFDAMSDDQLRASIEAAGGHVRANASRDTLLRRARGAAEE